MVTLRSVSKRAGVSIATVSKVLSNTPYFTEETRSKVMQAVEELGYVPNLAGRALSSGRTHIIAVVFPHVYDPIFQDPLVLHMLEGMEAVCSEHGYNLLLSTPQLKGTDENYERLIQSRYVDGIVALDNVPWASVLKPVREKGIPAVAIGYHEHEYSVRSDDFNGGYQVMQHVLDYGHRAIGIITVPENLNFSTSHRIRGMRAAAPNFLSYPQVEGDFSITSGAEAAEKLISKHPEITAIICLNDRMAIGAIQRLHKLGLSVPDHVTVVGYDDIPASAMLGLTTINQQAPAIGRAATQMLFEVLNNHKPEPALMPTQLIVRDSSAPLRS